MNKLEKIKHLEKMLKAMETFPRELKNDTFYSFEWSLLTDLTIIKKI